MQQEIWPKLPYHSGSQLRKDHARLLLGNVLRHYYNNDPRHRPRYVTEQQGVKFNAAINVKHPHSDEELRGEGSSTSKKTAEGEAAYSLLKKLQNLGLCSFADDGPTQAEPRTAPPRPAKRRRGDFPRTLAQLTPTTSKNALQHCWRLSCSVEYPTYTTERVQGKDLHFKSTVAVPPIKSVVIALQVDEPSTANSASKVGIGFGNTSKLAEARAALEACSILHRCGLLEPLLAITRVDRLELQAQMASEAGAGSSDSMTNASQISAGTAEKWLVCRHCSSKLVASDRLRFGLHVTTRMSDLSDDGAPTVRAKASSDPEKPHEVYCIRCGEPVGRVCTSEDSPSEAVPHLNTRMQHRDEELALPSAHPSSTSPQGSP